MISLRPYQQDLKDKTRNALISGYKAPLIVLGTGGGKTFIGCSIIKDALKKDRRILVLAHRDKLIRMWADDFDKLNIPYGIIQGDTECTEAPVKIASVDTYINRIGNYGDFDILLPDEAHRACADGYSKVINYHKDRGAVLVGMTATPARLDGIGLNNLFDIMITGVTMLDLIKDGYLTQMDIYSASPPDLDLELSEGEFNKSQYLRKVSGPARITGIVDICLEHTDKLGVTFAVNISDAKKITKEMNDNGISAVCIHSKQSKKHQDKVIKKWRSREYLQLVSVDVITEGFNEVEIQYSIDASPTGSLVKYIQRLGRVVRAWYKDGMPKDTREQRLEAIQHGNKPRVYHYDLCGNWWLWGNPWDDHGWTLDGVKITKHELQERVASARICMSCGRNYSSASDRCPYCGDPVKHAKRVIKEASGTLTLVTCEEYDRIEREKEEKIKAEADRKDEYHRRKKAAKTLEDYEAIERDLGLKRGWGVINYRIRQKYVDRFRYR